MLAASEMKAEVSLPFGLLDGNGRRTTLATLVPINGHGELLGAEDPDHFRATLSLLSSSIVRLGNFHERDVDLALLGSLTVLDRDYLLIQLNRLSFGDVRFQTVWCPADACGAHLDVRFDLSTVVAPLVAGDGTGRLELPDGRRVCYRWPTAGDQMALHGLPAAELESAFLERCVRGDGTTLGWSDVRALPPALRAEIVRRMVGGQPQLELTVDLQCLECGHPFRFTYDPVMALRAELRGSRATLLREVHYLAFYYHWSQSEILGLSRARRREYLSLLESALSAPTSGVEVGR